MARSGLCLVISAAFWALPRLPLAAPVIGNGGVSSGAAVISQSGAVTTVDQATAKATINWQSFGVAPSETVNFKQPDSSSITLNRVIGSEKSVIDGALNANGQVFLINSNGVLFGHGSRVNTAGLVGSTLDLSDQDFNAGTYRFKANGTRGSVVNQGSLTTGVGGYVALLGSQVSNQGVVTATRGTVALASGERINLRFDGNSLLGLDIEQGVLDALVENRKAIYADGGTVILTAQAADDLLTAQVNNTGLIQAQSIDDLLGEVRIDAHGGTTTLDGTLDVSSTTGSAGRITAQAGRFGIAPTTRLLASGAGGHQDGLLALSSSGPFSIGDGSSTLDAIALNTALAQLSVDLTAGSGNLEVNAPVNWSAHTFGLHSSQDININAILTATGDASFLATWGQSVRTAVSDYDGYRALLDPQFDERLYGINMAFDTDAMGQHNDRFKGRIDFDSRGTVTLGQPGQVQAYKVINTASELQAVGMQGNYILGRDIDLSQVGNWTPLASGGVFNGHFNGFGHVIANLKSTTNGLFRALGSTQYAGSNWRSYQISGPSLVNLGLTGVDIQVADAGYNSIGALVGTADGILKNVFAAGHINATQAPMESGYVGGMAGRIQGLAQNSYARVEVASHNYLYSGGFGGWIAGSARLANDYAAGNVTVTADPGMFTLRNGSMMSAGGFVGSFDGDTITSSYATGNVQGGWYLGGFVGQISSTGAIYRSYATGNVTLDDRVSPPLLPEGNPFNVEWRNTGAAGGFVGYSNGTIARSASSGRVSAVSGSTVALGGFSGYTNSLDIAFSINNYWNIETSGISFIGRGEGVVPDHSSHHGEGWSSSGSATPVADALGLTPEQLHRGSQGLTAEQFANVQQYQNGPIGQSVANQTSAQAAAEAAAQQAAAEAAAQQVAAQVAAEAAAQQQAAAQAAAQQAAAQASAQHTAAQAAVPVTRQQNRAVQALSEATRIRDRYQQELAKTSAATLKVASSGMPLAPPVDEHIHFNDAGSFSANIRSISVDGVQFDLEDEGQDEGGTQGKEAR